MFWKFNAVDSHVDELLTSPDVTLEKLMEEEDILQECKGQNMKLIEFLTMPNVMKKMVNLIIQEPPDDENEVLRYKSASIACELLTSDVNFINDSLVQDKESLDRLYSFLRPSEENDGKENSVNKDCSNQLNPLLASFFSKTLGILLTRKTTETIEYLKSKGDFVTLLVSHIGTSAIMDLWIKLVSCTEDVAIRTDILSWLSQENAMKKLVETIDSSIEEDRQSNASQTLCDIIRASREYFSHMQEKAPPDPLLESIESTETVLSLLDHMQTGERKDSVVISGIAVILSLLEFKKAVSTVPIHPPPPAPENEQNIPAASNIPENDPNALTTLDIERLEKGVSQTLDALKTRLEDIHSLLTLPQPKEPLLTTAGLLDSPFGQTRLQVVKLVLALIRANAHSINIGIAKLGIMTVLIDLFFKYSLNNFLHTQVEQCIDVILANEPTKDDVNSETQCVLINQLFEEPHIVQRILDAWKSNQTEELKPGGHRKGYMGHLTKIANHIVDNMECGPNTEVITSFVKNLPENYAQQWEAFVSGSLAEINKKNTIVPVAIVNPPPSTEEEEPNYVEMAYNHETALQQAFSHYQMQQMTSNFNDQFGFHEDEFADQGGRMSIPVVWVPAAKVDFNMSANEDSKCFETFEEVCRQRIPAFDDSESSDEDVWADQVYHPSVKRINRSNSEKSNESTDSEEERATTQSERSRNTENFSTPGLTSSSSDEVKMDVDAWTANFDSVPVEDSAVAMETQNIWDNPSNQDGDASNQADWANFATFESNFGGQDPFRSHATESSSKASPLSDMETANPPGTDSSIADETKNNHIRAIDEKNTAGVNNKTEIWGEAKFTSGGSSVSSSFTDNFSFSSEAIKTNSSGTVESEHVFTTEKQGTNVTTQSSSSSVILESSSAQVCKDSS